MTWKDTTSWSKSDDDRSVPREWTYCGSVLRIVVHHLHGAGDGWYVSCDGLFDRADLCPEDADGAKSAAANAVCKRLARMLAEAEGARP